MPLGDSEGTSGVIRDGLREAGIGKYDGVGTRVDPWDAGRALCVPEFLQFADCGLYASMRNDDRPSALLGLDDGGLT